MTGKFYEPQTTAGKYAETAGEFVPGALLAPGGMARNAIQYGVIPGLTSEAAGQITKGTANEPIARAIGGIAGALTGPSLANLPGRMISPIEQAASHAPLVQTLEKEDPLTAGQSTGSKPLQWIESTLGDIPGAGNKAHEIQNARKEAFTSAALKRAGIDAPLATPDVMARGYNDLGSKFEDLGARNTLTMDPAFATDLGKVAEDYVV